SMPNWLKWGFWLSPLSYAEVGLTGNEFLAPRWQKMTISGVTIGRRILIDRGLDFSGYFYWISVAALIGFILLFNIGFAIGLTIKQSPVTSLAIISLDKTSIFHGRDQEKSKDVKIGMRRMALLFTPLTISFQDVNYYVDAPMEMRTKGNTGKKLQLLHNITRAFQPGVLSALMGVTGAGKTTLLDVLARRKTGGVIEGDIRLGGYSKSIPGVPKIKDNYNPSTWMLEVAMEIPYVLVQPVLYMLTAYPMIGYAWTAAKFFWFFYTMFCTLLYFLYFGMLMVSITPNIEVASIYASMFYRTQHLLFGFVVPLPHIPKWWMWLYYISLMSWTLNVLITTQFGCENDTNILIFGETKPTAEFVREYFGFHQGLLPLSAIVLAAFPVLFNILFSYSISRLDFQKR
ncbi:hypothetical protein E2562_035359, partial [Oryza meyeriana var. granulata]